MFGQVRNESLPLINYDDDNDDDGRRMTMMVKTTSVAQKYRASSCRKEESNNMLIGIEKADYELGTSNSLMGAGCILAS